MLKKLSQESIKSARPRIDDLKSRKRFPVSVVVENVRSLYNVGSIFRTSDGAFIEKLYLTGYTGSPPRKEIAKTALGSVESVEWVKNENQVETVISLKKKGYRIVALEHTSKSINYNEFKYEFPLCLVIGNEIDGISEELIGLSDTAVDIPMYGLKQSLNVAVAYGIVVYHIINEYRRLL